MDVDPADSQEQNSSITGKPQKYPCWLSHFKIRKLAKQEKKRKKKETKRLKKERKVSFKKNKKKSKSS